MAFPKLSAPSLLEEIVVVGDSESSFISGGVFWIVSCEGDVKLMFFEDIDECGVTSSVGMANFVERRLKTIIH